MPYTPKVPLTVLVTTRNEEANIERTLASVTGLADQVCILDSESSDRTVQLAKKYTDEVVNLAYDHSRIIPWIFQWGLDNLPIRNEWVLILEADQAVTPALRKELVELLAQPDIREHGFYIRRRQIFRGHAINYGGYGHKYLLKLFRRSHSELDALESDTRVYVRGRVGKLQNSLEEWNRREDSILFYLDKHLRYVETFAREEHKRVSEGLPFKGEVRFFGTPDQRILWMKRVWFRMPLFIRPFLYFGYRYFLLLGFLDGPVGFLFHFLQAFWFRFILDIRLHELRKAGPEQLTAPPIQSADATNS